MGSATKEARRYYCNPGSRLAPKHAVRIDEQGHKSLVRTGEMTDIYAKIQSHVDECDIQKIWERAQTEGYEILNKRETISGDVTLVPGSMLEAAQKLQDMENDFNQLPLDVRRNFNFSFTEYIAEAGKDVESWGKKMGYIKEQPIEEPEPIKEGGEE